MSKINAEVPNRFLRTSDYSSVVYQSLRKEFECLYSNVFKGKIHTFGAKTTYKTKIHWSRDWEYPWAVTNSGVQAGQRILDCGCGGPPFLPFMASYGLECFGIDTNAGQWFKRSRIKLLLDRLRCRPINNLRHYNTDPRKAIGKKINFVAGSFTDLPFIDSFFDRIFCLSVLEHLDKKIALAGLAEMARVLKKNGRLLMTIDYDGDHVHKTMKKSLKDIIKFSGLELFGEEDFSLPGEDERPGNYNIAGLVLTK